MDHWHKVQVNHMQITCKSDCVAGGWMKKGMIPAQNFHPFFMFFLSLDLRSHDEFDRVVVAADWMFLSVQRIPDQYQLWGLCEVCNLLEAGVVVGSSFVLCAVCFVSLCACDLDSFGHWSRLWNWVVGSLGGMGRGAQDLFSLSKPRQVVLVMDVLSALIWLSLFEWVLRVPSPCGLPCFSVVEEHRVLLLCKPQTGATRRRIQRTWSYGNQSLRHCYLQLSESDLGSPRVRGMAFWWVVDMNGVIKCHCWAEQGSRLGGWNKGLSLSYRVIHPR